MLCHRRLNNWENLINNNQVRNGATKRVNSPVRSLKNIQWKIWSDDEQLFPNRSVKPVLSQLFKHQRNNVFVFQLLFLLEKVDEKKNSRFFIYFIKLSPFFSRYFISGTKLLCFSLFSLCIHLACSQITSNGKIMES